MTEHHNHGEPVGWQRAVREARRAALDAARLARRHLEDPAAQRFLKAFRESVLETGPALMRTAVAASERFRTEFMQAMPPNWGRLTHPQIFDAVELMSRTGWSLVWTPPAEVVVEILEAPDAEARRAVLLAAEPVVLADLDRLSREMSSPDLEGARAAALEALEAHQAGLFRASQALTAATLSTVIHEQFAESSHRVVRKLFADADKREAQIREFRWIAVQRAVAKVLEEYNPATGRPERSDFNRHATSHRVKSPQYRQVNSLSALMLLVSFLIEVQTLGLVQGANQRAAGDGSAGAAGRPPST